MPTLPDPLIRMLQERIADPKRRHFGGDDEKRGVSSDPEEISRFLNRGMPDDINARGDPFADMFAKMREWGQSAPPMQMSTDQFGNRRASTDIQPYALAPPASEEELAKLAQRIGRTVPDDLRQMFAIANGGWGPGYAFTPNHGPGLQSVEGVILALDDLERRGPGYTGEMTWPPNLLPIGDLMGVMSYDLDSGRIVQWDDHWYDHDKTIDQAFSVSHASLTDLLQEWLLD